MSNTSKGKNECKKANRKRIWHNFRFRTKSKIQDADYENLPTVIESIKICIKNIDVESR